MQYRSRNKPKNQCFEEERIVFLFQISNYDDLHLEAETEELLRQRLEAHSRRTIPGIWKVTDALNSLCRSHKKRRVRIPAFCKKEANTLLEGRRAVDWSQNPVKISFDNAGMTVCAAEDQEQEIVAYDKIVDIFETEHLWLLIYGNEKALLLQKKDLISGNAATFSSHILQKIKD